MLLVSVAMVFVSPAANATGTYDNATIADKALSYVGKSGGNACTDAGKAASGECRQFVNCVVYLASSKTQWPVSGTGDYQTGFSKAGGIEVAASEAVKGDIIQVVSLTFLHTAIVVSNLGGGKFNVVDSNWGHAEGSKWVLDKIVRQHDWTVPAGARFWRMGQVVNANPDTDGDGFTDDQDLCPTIYGKYRGCPLKSDFSLDGRDDVAAFYRYDNNQTSLTLWNGQTNGYTTSPYAPWTQGSFDASRLLPAGNGNFNGDRYQDVASFYVHDNGIMDLDIWYGTGGSYSTVIAWHVDTSWEGARLIPAGAADYNNDGRTDLAAFYRYDNNLVNLYVWYGQTNGMMAGPYTVWSGQGWDGSRIIPVGSGDVDGDGKPDIATFYRHDNGMMDYNVWYGNGQGAFTLYRPWHVDSGWDGTRFVPGGLADINGDSRLDAIVFYRHDNNLVDMRVWWGTATRTTGEPGGPWSASGWDGSRIIPAGTGDYNGDGKADVAAFYRHDGQMVDLNIWYGNGAGGLTLICGAWHTDTGWEGARLIPAKG